MLVFTEEHPVRVFEDYFCFNTDGKNDHGHDKCHEHFLTGELAFVTLLDLSDRDEQLFHVVLIERKRIQMPENIPIRQVTDQADQLGCISMLVCNLFFGSFDVRLEQIRLP